MKLILITAVVLLIKTEVEAVCHCNDQKFIVSIQKNSADGKGPQHICGAAIIDKFHVITAAHCVYGLGNGAQLRIRTDQRDAETNSASGGTMNTITYYDVAELMCHPSYDDSNGSSHLNDIAILKVNGGFDLDKSDAYMKVDLPNSKTEIDYSTALYSGFLVKNFSDHSVGVNNHSRGFDDANDYVYQDTRVWPLEWYEKITPKVTDAHIVTNFETDIGVEWIGNDGGPLVFHKHHYNQTGYYTTTNTIIGIRIEPKLYSKETLALFTRVSSHLQFIEKVLSAY
ncbi:chymotrypsin-1-like [Copidosoma floridanum]|uniref:chymotrypsin-1-like n=1 Tax=Copidosoma floridanum TaxID=29053 RepID=UPI0006C9659F|nr:chymotrypsin-1-like [Copidosoma floridanum]